MVEMPEPMAPDLQTEFSCRVTSTQQVSLRKSPEPLRISLRWLSFKTMALMLVILELIQTCTDPNCDTCTVDPNNCEICANNYWLTFSNCNLIGDIPTGYGADLMNFGSTLACSDTAGCEECKADYSKCGTCKTNYWLHSDSLCYLISNIPPGAGADHDSAVRITKPCQQSVDCELCQADYKQCTKCKASTWLHTDAKCYADTAIPTGFGADLSSTNRITSACSDSTKCEECKSDHTKCTHCKVNFWLNANNCYSAPDIPTGYGADNSNSDRLTKVCSGAPNCQECKLDYTKCEICAANYWLQADICYLINLIPTGFGADLNAAQRVTKPCVESDKCEECKQDYSKCTKCKSTYWLQSTTCYLISNIPTGFGADTLAAERITKPCSDSVGCQECKSDYSKCATCSTNYWLRIDTCYLLANIPTGFGVDPDSSERTTLACQDSTGCLECKSNYKVCATCKTANSYYMYNSVCTLSSNLPVYPSQPYGADSVNKIARTCQDLSNCLDCRLNYQICTRCAYQANPPLFANIDGICKEAYLLDPSVGAELTTGASRSCQDTNCNDCRLDYTKCVTCKPASLRYSYQDVCKLPQDLPERVGAKLATMQTAPCTDTVNCRYCRNDYMKCQTCFSTLGYYAKDNICIALASIPAGFGADYTNGVALACSKENCLECQSDYTWCTKCNSGAGWFAYSGNCVLASTLPDKTGGNLATGATSPCTVSSCKQCQASHLTCEACDSGWILLEASNVCQTVSQIAPGYGVDTNNGKVRKCQDVNCRLCQANYLQCTNCKGDLGYFAENFVCKVASAIDDGKGGDITNGVVLNCQSTGCILCKPNYLICTKCDRSASKYLYSSQCYSPSALINSGYGANSDETTQDPVAKLCPSSCIDCKLNYKECEYCNVGGSYFLDSATKLCKHASAITGAFGGNTITSVIEACSDTGCVDCRYNKDNCVKCDSVLDYFAHNNDCYLSTNLPPGRGADRSSPTVGVSQGCLANCEICKNNYLYCEKCFIVTNYFLREPQKDCIYYTTIPDDFGGDRSTSFIRSCADTGCRDCKYNYENCVACYANLDLYAYLGDCKSSSQLIPGKGANPNGVATNCAQTYCLECQPNYLECTKCNTAANYFLNSAKVCIYVTSIPAGYGGDFVTTKVDTCTKLNCQLCQANREICTNCYSGSGDDALNFFSYNGDCVAYTALPAGLGGNRLTGAATACSVIGCLECQRYHDKCTLCNYANNNGYFLLDDGFSCGYYTSFAINRGGNLVTGRLDYCARDNCEYCRANIEYCDACRYSSNPYFAQGGVCKLAQDLNIGTGAVIDLGTSQNCVVGVPGCQECNLNYLVCTKCDKANGWFLDVDSKCKRIESIPDFYGPDLTFGTVVKCIGDPYCLKCEADHTKCTVCVAGQKYSYFDTCYFPSELPPQGWGASISEGIARACDQTTCDECQPNYLLCTKCFTATFNYLKPDGYCVHRDSIADGKGANTVLGTVVDCQDSTFCNKCKPDHTYCDACKLNSDKFAQDGVCRLRSELTGAFGANTVNGIATPCSVSKCTKCQNVHTYCEYCTPAEYYYLEAGGCVHVDSIDDYKGAYLAEATVVSCASTGCVKCKPNKDVCTSCEVTPGGFYLDLTVCVQYNNIPSGRGITTDGKILDCDEGIYCTDCRADYLTCVECNTGLGYYLLGKKCIHYTAADPGWGANQQTGKLVECLNNPLCHDCEFDYRYCVQCATSSPQKLVYTDSKCYYPAPVQRLGTGTSYLWEACQDIYCLDCTVDRTKCVICDASPGVVRYSHENICKLVTQLPPARGADPGTGVTYDCESTGCIECSANYKICTLCNTDLKYYLNEDTQKCQYKDDIADYKGANLLTGRVAMCNSTGCLKCKDDRMICIECDKANNYWREETYCFHYTNAPKIPIGRGVARTEGLVKHCTDTHCLDCFYDYTICLVCDKANKFFLNVTDCTEDVAMPAGWGGNADSGVATRCTDTNCYRCNYDYRVCFQCNVSSPQMFVYKANDICTAPVLENLGVSTTYYWESCTDATYCKYCAADVNFCTNCYMGARPIAKFAFEGNCLIPSQMLPGKGSDWTDGTVQNCQSTGCIECSVDRLICKKCNTDLDYWLDNAPSAQKCYFEADIIDYWGAKKDEGIIAMCNSTGCLKCKDDRMICIECDKANNYWREETYCFHYTNAPKIPIGRGVNREEGLDKIKHCNDTHCLDCFADHRYCVKCDKDNGWYLNLTYCRHVDDMPAGWGANLDTGVSKLCLDTNCYRCNYDYRVCFQCNTTVVATQMYVFRDNATCVFPPPETWGVGTSYYWEKCTDPYCKWCILDKTKCQVCYTEPGYQAFKDKCYLPEDLEEGTGSDWSTGTSIRCNSTGCLNCNFDYMTCKRCNVKQEYYLEGTWCKKWDTIADFKGGDVPTGRVQSCSDRGCVNCKRNSSHCVLCNQPERYYLDPPGWWCILYPDIPYGKGTHNESGTLKLCSQPGCSVCFPDYQSCTACKTQTGYYLNESNSTCVNIKDMGLNFGPNLNKGTIEKCQSLGCLNCSLNAAECVECDADLGYVILNGICNLNYDPALFVRSAWDSDKKTATASFSFYPDYLPNFEAILNETTIIDTANGAIYTYKELNGEAKRTPLGFEMKFTTTIDILSGVITIPMSDKYRILDKNARSVFAAYPIQLAGVYLVKPTQTTQSATETMDRAASTKSLITMAMVSFNPMVAISLDFLFNELFVLRLYEGPFIAYPDLILKSTSNASALPIQVDNWFESDIDENACVASEQFDVTGNNCLFLDNWGDDLSRMIVMLAATFGISLIYWGLQAIYKWRKVQPGTFMKIMEFANFNYGLQLFHTKMEGEKIEIIVHLMLSMRHRKTALMYPSNIVAMVVLQAYYWTIAIMAVSFSAEVGRYLTRSPAVLQLLRKHNEEQKKLAEVVGSFIKKMTVAAEGEQEGTGNQLVSLPKFTAIPDILNAQENRVSTNPSPHLSRGNTQNLGGNLMSRANTVNLNSPDLSRRNTINAGIGQLSRGNTQHLGAQSEMLDSPVKSEATTKSKKKGTKKRILQIRPLPSDQDFDLQDLERPAGREEHVETPPSSERSHDIPGLDLGELLGLRLPSNDEDNKSSVQMDVGDLEAEVPGEYDSESEYEDDEEEVEDQAQSQDPTTLAKTPQLNLFSMNNEGVEGLGLDPKNPVISLFQGLGEKQKEVKSLMKKKKKKKKEEREAQPIKEVPTVS